MMRYGCLERKVLVRLNLRRCFVGRLTSDVERVMQLLSLSWQAHNRLVRKLQVAADFGPCERGCKKRSEEVTLKVGMARHCHAAGGSRWLGGPIRATERLNSARHVQGFALK